MKIIKEDNVPPPEDTWRKDRAPTIQSHFDGLRIGESLHIGRKTTRWAHGRISLTRKKWPERRFTTRKTAEGVRVWRLADAGYDALLK